MSHISFQGKSNLYISKDMFNEAVKRSEASRRSCPRKTFEERVLIPHQAFVALPDNGDLMVVLRNERNGFIKRFPVFATLENIQSYLFKKINTLQKNSNEKLTAWIIGGTSHNHDNGKTIKAVNKFCDVLCDKPEIDTSILVGPKFKTENAYGIRGYIGQTEICIPQQTYAKVTDEDDLGNLFDIVELNNVQTIISENAVVNKIK